MNYIVALCVTVCICLLSYIALNKKVASNLRIFTPCDGEEYVSRDLSAKAIISICALLSAVSFFAVLNILGYVSDPIGVAKMIVALFCMTGAGCFDFREKRIPNIFPLVMVLSAVVLLLLGVILKQDGAVGYLLTNSVAAVSCGVLFFIAAAVTGQGIGAGDIKLIFSLALLGGVYTVIGSLLYGVLACAVAAVLSLISKKKTLKESLPFGPFIYIGYILTVFLMKY